MPSNLNRNVNALELALTALLATEKELTRALTSESDRDALNAYMQDRIREQREKLEALVDSLSQVSRSADP